MESKNVRIKDIARLAGVSVGTVDRVIHNRGNVSPEALKKIMAVLNKTGYKPNLLARTLGSNKKFIIATLIPEPSLDEYWEQSNWGINEAREEWSHYNVDVRPYFFDLYDKNSFEKSAKMAMDDQPDAILSSPVFHQEALNFFQSFQNDSVPYVFFNNKIPEITPLCFIGQDFYQSGRLGAELLELISETPCTFVILHIYEDLHNSVHLAQKESGFMDYFSEMENKGIQTRSLEFCNHDEVTLEKDLLSLVSDPDIKGLFITTSKGTYLTASFLKKHNRQDIKLVGYDLLSGNIDHLKLGTIDFLIDQNPKKQAALGVNYLANYLIFKKGTPNEDLFPLEIITRQNLKTFLGSSIQSHLKSSAVLNNQSA